MNKKTKEALKKCAWDITHCVVSSAGMIAACLLAAYVTAEDKHHIMYETLGSASLVLVSGTVVLIDSCLRLRKHVKELKQHYKGD